MAERRRAALVAGVDTPLGARVRARMEKAPFSAPAVGIELLSGPMMAREPGGPELDHRGLCELLRAREIDTIVHCAACPDRGGAVVEPCGADVVGTLRLCAVASDPSLPVRSLVVASSSAVYPTGSHSALLRRESDETQGERDRLGAGTARAASLLEAEDHARDTAARAPHLCVAILRLGELAGPCVAGPLADLFARPRIPSVVGFDPPLQWLHIDDAVRALAWAAEAELAGVYNAASGGVVHLREAVRALGRRTRPLLPVEAGPLQPLYRALGLAYIPNGLLGVLRFGLAMDTAKLAATGLSTEHDPFSTLEAMRTEAAKTR